MLTLDWLTLNVEDNFMLFNDKKDSFLLDEIYIERVDKRTSHFKQMAYLWRDNRKIATVTFNASSGQILKGRAHIKFENYLFYDGTIKAEVDQIINTFSLKQVKVSRCDLAVDGVNFHQFVNKYETSKWKQIIGLQPNKVGYFRNNDLNNCRPIGVDFQSIASGFLDSFQIGSYGNRATGVSKSSRFIRYYNKTKELRQLNHKQYISDWHKQNGFSDDVYRFEIELRSEYLSEVQEELYDDKGELKGYKSFHYTDLFDQDRIKNLFRTSLKGLFEWRYADDVNVSRCTPIELFSGLEAGKWVRIKKAVKDKLRTVKIMVKDLILKSVQLTSPGNESIVEINNYLSTVRQLIRRYDLGSWLDYRWQWLVEELKNEYHKYCSGLHKLNEYQLKANFYGA